MATRKKVDLSEGTLTIVFEGLKTVPSGPYKGEKTIGSMKVYVGEEQVGLLQRFKVEAFANEPLPRLEFDFGEHEPGKLRSVYEKTLTRIREFFPWARYVSPVGSSPKEELPTPLEQPK